MKLFQKCKQQNVIRSGLVALFLAATALPGFGKEPLQRDNPRVPATVRGFESADLFAKVGGYLKSVSADLGDRVEKGQVLAVIEIPELEKQLAQKRSHLALAKAEANQSMARVDESKSRLDALVAAVAETKTALAQKQALLEFENSNFDRISQLASSGAIQTELLDAAKYKLKAAEAEQLSVAAKVETANANLAGGKAAVRSAVADAAAAAAQIEVAESDVAYVIEIINYATIRAPWDGKITERMFDAGAFIQSAEGNSGAKPIFRIVRDDKVRVIFSLSQNDIQGLKKGLAVSLSEIAAFPDDTFTGKISRYSAELDPKTRMMRIEMDLENPDEKLIPGFFGYATVHYKD